MEEKWWKIERVDLFFGSGVYVMGGGWVYSGLFVGVWGVGVGIWEWFMCWVVGGGGGGVLCWVLVVVMSYGFGG